MPRRWPVALLALLASFTPPWLDVAAAHEIGTTRVAVWISADRYRAEIVTDAQALADKLAVAPKESPAEVLGSPLQDRGFAERFRDRVTLLLDGVRVHPAVTYTVSSPSIGATPVATIHLTGPLLERAQVLHWTYGWTYTSYSLTVHRDAGAQPAVVWLEGGQQSAPIALRGPAPMASRAQIAARYLRLGFTHIIPSGVDHVLFVLGMFLLTRRFRPLLLQITAFTVAHSVTLGLSLLGVVSVSPAVVEPLIALSIAYVALENLFVTDLKPWRVGLVFAFGLLHGLGFAGALAALEVPRSELVTALITFNLGVEAGQLAVIGAAFVLVGHRFGHRTWYRQRIVLPASALIACVGVFWTVQRLTL